VGIAGYGGLTDRTVSMLSPPVSDGNSGPPALLSAPCRTPDWSLATDLLH
jgi:hypothetical protein